MTLAELLATLGPSAHKRSRNRFEFVANFVEESLAKMGAKTLHINRASTWEYGIVILSVARSLTSF